MSSAKSPMANSTVTVGNAVFGNSRPLTLIAGPCQFESRGHAFDMADALKELCAGLGLGLVNKSSYNKANHTSLSSARAAVAGVFIETHEDPDNSTSSDGPNMIPLRDLPRLLETLMAFDAVAKR
ncbi:MAG: hypothetical protein Q8K28_09070 [Hoeflea sp.]|uniref:hypothetical protein n=1 Tax=Hoeflea sp. TaxID=1940281 RepID=UPI002730B7C6|nr:hypothetical protein [Hoeflea sp.]MDP2120041.1 hypothetical protein [Hoeflea sp.]